MTLSGDQTGWDPKVFHSLHQHLLDSNDAGDNHKGMVDKSSAFVKADFVAVNNPIANDDDLPRFDCYLDDIFGAFNPRDEGKGSAAIPLALHLVGTPHNSGGMESFPRDDIFAIPKFLAEAKPSDRWSTPGGSQSHCRRTSATRGIRPLTSSWRADTHT